ncbi:MAG TPA: FAD-dependent oxidoreductase [Candidatus Omnitrophota bacterium]|nr:FAD-dependent oxidoreductase [Candidatus Omnitrophota bacterium]
MLDLIIIGAGPAGITAAIYAARKKMNFVIISRDVGGQTAWSGGVENYTGYQFIPGIELVAKFEEHMKTFAVPLHEGESVQELMRQRDMFVVRTDKTEYQARTVIVASGKQSRELGVPGEKEFRNKGLTYCATCDGPLFANKDVAVIGGGNSALDAALQLMRIARRVYLINIAAELTGDSAIAEKLKNASNVAIYNNARITSVNGAQMVAGITVQKAALVDFLPVQGVFVEIGLIPSAEFIRDVRKNEYGEIMVNCKSETDVPGLFAAGDVTDVPAKQIIVAAGEGAKAALSAFHYVAIHSF